MKMLNVICPEYFYYREEKSLITSFLLSRPYVTVACLLISVKKNKKPFNP